MTLSENFLKPARRSKWNPVKELKGRGQEGRVEKPPAALVESGEGIERSTSSRIGLGASGYVEWNPVKELKANTSNKIASLVCSFMWNVESGEGIESQSA